MRKVILFGALAVVVVCMGFFAYLIIHFDQKGRETDDGENRDEAYSNYCVDDASCVWYEEQQGDPAGLIHCTGLNYANTCLHCIKLSESDVQNLPPSYECFCNSDNRCQEST